jgi:hypothetical protein
VRSRYVASLVAGLAGWSVGWLMFKMPAQAEVIAEVLRQRASLGGLSEPMQLAALIVRDWPGGYFRLEVLYWLAWIGGPWALVFLVASRMRRQQGVVRAGKLPYYEPPEKRKELYAVLGEIHSNERGKPSAKPLWKIIPAKGLRAGVAAIGSTGAGKTTSVAEPMIEQVINFRRDSETEKASGLFLQVKGNFASTVASYAERAGRGGDVVLIGSEAGCKYNPFGSKSRLSYQKADAFGRMMTEAHLGGGKYEAPFFSQAYTALTRYGIEVLELCGEWPTISKVFRLIGDQEAMRAKIKEADEQVNFSGQLYYTFSKTTHRNREDNLAKHGAALWCRLSNRKEEWIAPYSDGLDLYCHPWKDGASKSKRDVQHAEIRLAAASNADLAARLDTVRFGIEKVWRDVGKERWAEVVTSVSGIMDLFEYPPTKRTFCPEPNDPALAPTMEEMVESGKLIVTDLPLAGEERVSVAKIVGAMMKLDYYHAVTTRFTRKRPYRPTIFCCDEYDAFASEADARYAMRCREANGMVFVLYPSCSALQLAVGPAWESLFAMTSTRVFCKTNDSLTARRASELCGQHKVDRQSESISQQGKGRSVDMRRGGGTVSVSHSELDEAVFKPDEFLFMPVGQCICHSFDGVNTEVGRVYLKSASIPAEKRYAESVFVQEVS